MLVIASVLVWVVRFIMQRVFLIDLIDPLWSPRTTGPVSSGANLLMVTRAPLVEQFFRRENYAIIDLGAAGTSDADLEVWERTARTTLDAAEDWKNVLVLQADRAATDRRLKIVTLRLLEFAIDGLSRTVLMVSAQPLSLLGRSDVAAGADAEAEIRWMRLLATFVAVPVGAAEAGSIAPPGLGGSEGRQPCRHAVVALEHGLPERRSQRRLRASHLADAGAQRADAARRVTVAD